MGKYSRLGKNTALVFIGTAGSKLINLLMLPYYTRWLTTSDYGSVDLISTYTGLMLGIVSFSIFDSIFIFPKDQPKDIQKEYFSSSLFFWFAGMFISAIISVLIEYLSHLYKYSGFIIDWLWYIFACLGASYIQNLVQQFLRAIDKMLIYSTTGIVVTVCMIGFSFIFVPKWGVKGYVMSLILANLVATAYSMLACSIWKYIRIQAISRKALCSMLKYSIPLIPNGIMWFLINSFNRPLLESYCGLSAVGLFSVAGRFPNLLNTVYLLFQQAWLISVIEEAKRPTYTEFYNKMLKVVVAGQVLLAIILAFSAKWIIMLFTTEDFFISWQYIPILVIGVIFMNVATFVGSNFAVTRESRYYFYSTVWSGVVSVILNFALIPFIGIWGACISMVISQMICMLMRIKYSWHITKITQYKFYFYNISFLLLSSILALKMRGILESTIVSIIIIVFYGFMNKRQIINITNLVRQRYANRPVH